VQDIVSPEHSKMTVSIEKTTGFARGLLASEILAAQRTTDGPSVPSDRNLARISKSLVMTTLCCA